MLLQRPADRQQLDPGTPAVFSEFPQYSDSTTNVEAFAHFPTSVDRQANNPTITPGTLVRAKETIDFSSITYDQYVTDDVLAGIAGCADWTFLAIFHDASRSSAATYSAKSVSELQDIQGLINNTPTPVNDHANCAWYIQCGHITNSSFRKVTAADIDTLIADFQAIYGNVNAPNYAGNILP